jgi:membrane-associated protein
VPFVDLTTLIQTVGYIGVTLIIFAECGLLIGFFLPGDSLLFTAGFLASQHLFDIWVLSVLCGVAAVIGPAVGYWFGHAVGPRLFNREDSVFFHRKHLERAHEFYERHGGKALILARFMPVVRTFAPIVAGMAGMNYTRFVIYTLIGALVWAVGVTWAGYYLGSAIPDVDKYLLPIVVLIIIVSVAPSVIHVWRENRTEIVAWARSRLSSREAQPGGD